MNIIHYRETEQGPQLYAQRLQRLSQSAIYTLNIGPLSWTSFMIAMPGSGSMEHKANIQPTATAHVGYV